MIDRSELWRAVHHDLVDKCAATAPQAASESGLVADLFSSADRDLETVARRVEHEGDSFFTLTLPSFGKEFLRALDRGCLLPDTFRGWKRAPYGHTTLIGLGGGPAFMKWALQVVFPNGHVCSAEPDVVHPCTMGGAGKEAAYEGPAEAGSLRYFPTWRQSWERYDDDWAAECVHAVLQLSGLYSKEKSLASEARNIAALDAYVATDKELAEHLERVDFPLLQDRLTAVRKVITLAFARVLSDVDQQVYYGTLLPKHGSGATADRLFGNEKWLLTEWTERLERLFPHGEMLNANDRLFFDSSESVVLRTPENERHVKVMLVPKTQATPRVIAVEPTCMQYVQQGFLRALVPALEADRCAKHFVGFTDQEPNRRLAALGSAGGDLATLDLSEASDRVANWLVEAVYEDFPHFLEGVQACRSTRASLPDGRVLDPIVKFASMGSALTFPIEAMTFAAICLESVCRTLSLPLTPKSLRSLQGLVRVYGDDIVVPRDCAEQVTRDLELFGFKVNRHKSYWTGEFRESCGEEYWRGRDVSHTKVRTSFPTSLRSAKELISTVETRNQLFSTGYVEAVEALDRSLLPIMRGKFPIVLPSSPLLGRLALDPPHWRISHKDYQVPLEEGYTVVAKSPVNKLDGPRALLKYFLSPSKDEEHLTRSGRPRSVRVIFGMAPVY